jgi:hypothetical protein
LRPVFFCFVIELFERVYELVGVPAVETRLCAMRSKKRVHVALRSFPERLKKKK